MFIRKTTYLVACLAAFQSFSLSAQWVTDSVQMGPGYRNEVFYALGSGIQGTSPLADWELAHTQVKMDNAIRANHVAGVRVIPYPKGALDAWNSFDTTGWQQWRMVFNDLKKRELGAFNQQKGPGMWDFSWGVYNTTTHEVVGDSLYLLILNAGSPNQLFRKFYPVKQDDKGNLQIRIAALDGSGDTTMNVLSTTAGNRQFKYLHLQKKDQPLREPATAWDLVFTQYFAPTFDPMSGRTIPYPVMGVESNAGVMVAAIVGVDRNAISPADWKNQVADDLTAIGSNWKSFSRTTNKFVCRDSLSYLIKANGGQYWLLYFSRFDGSASGKIMMHKQQTNLASVRSFGDVLRLNVYPNPAVSGKNIILATDYAAAHHALIQLTDASGRVLFSDQRMMVGLQQHALPTAGLSAGTYFVTLMADGKKVSVPVIIP